MPTTVILGSQWGDEGKGKLTDILATDAQLCARAAGGHNAGHQIVTQGVSYSFHLLPSGLINPNCTNLIGSGVVFHVPSFFSELKELDEKGLPQVYDRILVSDRVHINLDLHLAVDGLEEVELGEHKIGTTGRGIGPCYSTKAARSGIRLAEVFNTELFELKLRRLASGFAKRYGDLLRYDVEDEIARFREYRPKLARFAIDAVPFMQSAQENNMNILVEGANIQPELGWAVSKLKISEKLARNSRNWARNGERPLVDGVVVVDLVVLRYSMAINYYTALNLTKLDVLDTFETIKIAVAYKDPESGEELVSYPSDPDTLDRAHVVYHEMPGWKRPTTNVKTFDDLPKQAQDYVKFIESFIGVKVKWIGTGPDRESMIKK
ncbi:adenylosuccinate synthetase protein [Pochonia chlamydosporia 170]|uniref:Adenylosuccinate synthetase n=1 Tax=Pochonia chlamydosporia 170 TaxID=1380566 RepID=A0A179G796_METCM|nr:adenylosuccinate synthetase protein [Pochonia chlamydosporia 170]OAQ73380.1 adenylosuccinate synthetase protein [Pochonia chlamydosporia 170]